MCGGIISNQINTPCIKSQRRNIINTQSTACNFAAHENKINAGALTELQGWWSAAQECIKNFHKKNGTPNVMDYARVAHAISYANRNKNKGQYFEQTTIQQQVNACVKAILLGHKVTDFSSVKNIKDTYAKVGTRTVKPAPKKTNVNALFMTAEFKALPAEMQKKIKNAVK